MSLIRSKLRIISPKSYLKPFSLSFCSSIESTQNPNLSDNDDETPINSNSITSQEIPIVEKFYNLINDHYKINPNFIQNPNPNLTITSLSLAFSHILPNTSISPSVFASVIEKCRSLRHGIPLAQSLAFFNWAIEKEENVDVLKKGFIEIVDLAGKVKEFDVAWGLIDDMKTRKIEIPLEVFVRLIRRYARAGLVDEAVRIFDKMEEYDCKPDVTAFTAVIYVLVKKRKVVEAQSFFNGLKDRFGADVVAYTSLINGWCRVGEISEAERVFSEMKKENISPNVYTYSTVIDGLCRHGQINRAHDVFAEMIEKGCEPNAVTFNNLMRVHVKAGNTEKVRQVFNQMKRLGCQPDDVSYNFLIACHCKDGNKDEALKLVQLMISKGCKPSVHSFNPIFNCVSVAKDFGAAKKLLEKMKEIECQPNVGIYNVLLRMSAESKSIDMVMKLKKEMDELKIEANVNTYKILVSALCQGRYLPDACMYLREMIEEKNLKPSKPLCEMILKRLTETGKREKQEKLIELLVQKGFAAQRPQPI